MANKIKHVLVAPLDWGLGHATRCIPIIQILLRQGCKVSVASAGAAYTLLQQEFPSLKFYKLPTYGASYSKRIPFMINLVIQLPKFLFIIFKEKKILGKIAKQNPIDLIISDNRYGCRLPKIRSVFICHQINIMMPYGMKWLSSVINFFNHRWIAAFDKCWIPDDPNKSLTGNLSNPGLKSSTHVGLLSRFERKDQCEAIYQLAVVLSGPEPQRTIFEQLILSQLKETDLKVIVVRGMYIGISQLESNDNLTIVNHLDSISLQEVIEQSSYVLCRSGYTSIMDLAVLGKKAIFVPTPGQTEQEYLGKLLVNKNIALCQRQKDFNLKKALTEIKNYTGFAGWSRQPNLLQLTIEEALK